MQALDLGADDYVTKPFGLKELAARVRAVLRRTSRPDPSDGIYDGKHLRANFPGVAVTVDGRPVRLTHRELELLECLVSARNRVLTRAQLIDRVWPGYDPVGSRTVDVHVGRLRSKLGDGRPPDRDRLRRRLPLRRGIGGAAGPDRGPPRPVAGPLERRV